MNQEYQDMDKKISQFIELSDDNDAVVETQYNAMKVWIAEQYGSRIDMHRIQIEPAPNKLE